MKKKKPFLHATERRFLRHNQKKESEQIANTHVTDRTIDKGFRERPKFNQQHIEISHAQSAKLDEKDGHPERSTTPMIREKKKQSKRGNYVRKNKRRNRRRMTNILTIVNPAPHRE